jgi:hypothetical protein
MKLHLPWGSGSSKSRADDWADELADDPTVSLLRDFAVGPMSADPDTLDRMSTRMGAEFAQRTAERRVAGSPGVSRTRRPRLRLAVAFASVAVLAVAGTAAAATESGPGQPFYHARLTVEAIFLPPAGTDARLAADLDRAEARLAEAETAAGAGNWNAEADALGAYGEVVRSMVIASDTDAGVQARMRLGQQLAILQRLQAGAGDGAGAQVGRAIDDVGTILRTPGSGGSPAVTPTGNGPQPTPAGTGQGGPNPSAGSGSTAGTGPDGSTGSGGGSGTGAASTSTPGPQGTGQGGMPSGEPGGQETGAGQGSGGR